MNKQTIKQTLDEKGVYVSTMQGMSMYPMLKNRRDTVVIKKNTERLKKYDVALYIRKSDNAHILHRVIEVKSDGYVFRGDNCSDKEYGICDNDVLGVLYEFYNKNRKYSCSSLKYKLYSRLVVFLHPLRNAVVGIYKRISK